MKVFYAVIYHKPYTSMAEFFDLDLNLLISAGYLWSDKDFIVPKISKNIKRIFLDSGGFQMLTRYKDFPFSPEQYVNYVEKVNPHYYASMDYPCEPELRETHDVTVNEQIEKTIQNQIDLIDLETNSIFVPVIQGWEPKDYVHCIDRMKDHGLLSNYMAIGSVCVRRGIKRPRKILKQVKANLPKSTAFHGFGLKTDVLNDQFMFNNLYSSDSMAWNYPVRFGRVTIFTGTRLRELHNRQKLTDAERGRVALKNYVEFMSHLIEKQGQQLNLHEHVRKNGNDVL